MQRNSVHALILVLLAIFLASPSQASTLRVSPVLVDMPVRAATSALRLQNGGSTAVTVQVRVMQWAQENGKERLFPTKAVAISPPMALIKPGATQLVRVVRVANTTRTREESFRVIVDEIPDARRGSSSGVQLAVRHSLPVFFAGEKNAPPELSWTIEKVNGGWHCVVRNAGDRRARIAGLKVASAQGHSISFGEGLIGYVLGASTMSWPLPPSFSALRAEKHFSISAHTESGRINAIAKVSSGR